MSRVALFADSLFALRSSRAMQPLLDAMVRRVVLAVGQVPRSVAVTLEQVVTELAGLDSEATASRVVNLLCAALGDCSSSPITSSLSPSRLHTATDRLDGCQSQLFLLHTLGACVSHLTYLHLLHLLPTICQVALPLLSSSAIDLRHAVVTLFVEIHKFTGPHMLAIPEMKQLTVTQRTLLDLYISRKL